MQVEGAGGRGSACNGSYKVCGKHNGKPLYIMEGGGNENSPKIYFSGYWKISVSGSTSGWIYGVDSAAGRGPFPPTVWSDDGYGDSDNRPFPSLVFLCQSEVLPQGHTRFDDMPVLKTFFSDMDRHLSAAGHQQFEWLQDFRALCAAPVSWEMSTAASQPGRQSCNWCNAPPVPFDAYVAMATLLSLKDSLLKTTKLKRAELVCQAHLDEALRNAVLPEIKSSMRELRTHLNAASLALQQQAAAAAVPDHLAGPSDCELDEDDVIIVMEQTRADRARAEAALREFRDAAGAVLALEEQEAAWSAAGSCGDAAAAARGGRGGDACDVGGVHLLADDDSLLPQLAIIVTRVSLMMMHLVRSLPLAALAVDYGGAAGLAGDGAGGDSGPQVRAGGVASAGACEDAQHTSSLRRLLGAGTQLMLKDHKAPLIKAILDANPIAHASSRPEITVAYQLCVCVCVCVCVCACVCRCV